MAGLGGHNGHGHLVTMGRAQEGGHGHCGVDYRARTSQARAAVQLLSDLTRYIGHSYTELHRVTLGYTGLHWATLGYTGLH